MQVEVEGTTISATSVRDRVRDPRHGLWLASLPSLFDQPASFLRVSPSAASMIRHDVRLITFFESSFLSVLKIHIFANYSS